MLSDKSQSITLRLYFNEKMRQKYECIDLVDLFLNNKTLFIVLIPCCLSCMIICKGVRV